jgi:hypothetical protein
MFIKSDSKNMGIFLLKKLCQNLKIKDYSKLTKLKLIEIINRNFAARTIQRQFRRYFYKNAVDHITLEPVDFPCFVYRTKSGRHYFYSHDSIIKYIMKSGNTRDPMTREQYSDEDLQRLDLEAKRFYPGIKYRSTYKIKKNLAYARRIKNRENEIMVYQMRLDEIKELLLFIVESDMGSWEISNETVLIENVEYASINAFIDSVLRELKIIIISLRAHEPYLVESFKSELDGLSDKNNILDIIKEF